MEMRMNIYRLSAKLFFYYKKLDNILKIFKIDKDRKIHKIDNFDFKKLLSGFNIEYGSNIFIHAGLKKINQVSGKSYNDIVDEIIYFLKKLYFPKSLIAPSFTPSFRKSGVYSKLYSRGEYGAFSEIFRQKSDYRTDDAIHSVSIISNDLEEFFNLNYNETFADDGFYASLINNSYVINISTQYFVSTYMHYLEETLKVPYKYHQIEKISYKGVMYDENNLVKNIVQINHAYKFSTVFNRDKIEKILRKNNVIQYKNYQGIIVSCIKVFDLDRVLRKEIIKNPYFLVSF
jgi:aminoglycoside 3-N-acetyltransferase